MNPLRLGRLLAMWLLMAAGLGMPAAALGANACSASAGKVTLNEYNYIDNFTEVKKLDASVDMTGWKVTVYTSNRTTSGALPTSGTNSCFGGVYQVNQFSANQTSQNADIVLFDNNNDVVDILRVRTANTPFTTAYYPSSIPACGFVSSPYDLQVSAANKGVDRTPDGLGPWRNTPGTGAGSYSTECGGNAPGAAPGSFNAFETSTVAGATSGVIKTKVAGSAFGLHVVAISGGAQESAFSDTVKVELLGNTTTGIGLDANNCPTSFTLLQTIASANIANGRSTVGFAAVSDAWKDVRVRISYPASSPTSTSCSTDNFAIRPASLAVSAHDKDWENAGPVLRPLANTAVAGGNVHKAGRPFTLRATGLNASDNPAGNYAGSPTFKTLVCTLPAAPSACINGILALGVWSGSGTVTNSSASYSEAGSFNLTLEDQTFADVDIADSTLLERTIPQAIAVPMGRFVPDHFVVTTNNTPEFKTFNDTTCAIRPFTYVGQPFGYAVRPTATILAKDKDNHTVANYKSSLWKIGDLTGLTTPVVIKNCLTSPDPNTCVFTTIWDAASGSSEVAETYTYALMPASTPNWDDNGSTATAASVNTSTGLITFAASDTLVFKRSNTTPQALFTASITNVISAKDMSEEGNCGVANCDITTATPAEFINIGFDEGDEFRFGRLALTNAHGSELLDLPVPIETQYWNGSGFVRNTADSCTQFNATDVSLSNWQRYLDAGETSVSLSGRFNAGRGNLKLSKPGEDNTGSVDLALQLGAASQTWLQGRWTGGAYDQDPSARASFGLYRGSKSLIYLREMY